MLTINARVHVSRLPNFGSIQHQKAIIFDTRKTSYLKDSTAKLLKTYLKDNSHIYFIVIYGILILLNFF